MKYIDSMELHELGRTLSSQDGGSISIQTKLEAYTNESDSSIIGGNSFSPPPLSAIAAAKTFDMNDLLTSKATSASRRRSVSLGEWKPSDMSRKRRSASLSDIGTPSKKILFEIITALGEIFPDFDYRFTSSHMFISKPISQVVREVNSYLSDAALASSRGELLDNLWLSLDGLLNIASGACEIYSYMGDKDDNGPLNDHQALWSFNLFFYNKELHRMCYFGCKGSKNNPMTKYRLQRCVSYESINEDYHEDATTPFHDTNTPTTGLSMGLSPDTVPFRYLTPSHGSYGSLFNLNSLWMKRAGASSSISSNMASLHKMPFDNEHSSKRQRIDIDVEVESEEGSVSSSEEEEVESIGDSDNEEIII